MDDVRLEVTADANRWTAAALRSGQPVTVFHTYRWLNLAARLTHTSFTPFVVRLAGADVGIAPWLTRRRGPLATVNWVPFPYVGPLVAASHLAPTVRALDAVTSGFRTVQRQLCFPPRTDVCTAALESQGFTVHMDRTYEIDTGQDQDTLWRAVTQRTRNTIRSAERGGVTISEATDTRVLGDVVQSIFDSRGIRSGYTNFPPSMEEIDRLGVRVRIAVASVDDIPVGCLSSLIHESHAIGWVGGIFPRYRSTNANAVLHWDAITWAHREGAEVFDMAGVPDEGIGRFKRQFGGRLVEYPVAVKSSAAWRVLDRIRRMRGQRLAR